jgi:uncharacterized lipoprotein YbaY
MGILEIRGWIRLPSPQVFDGAVAIVRLEDVGRIDAPSKCIARTVLEPIRGRLDRIPFRLMVQESLLTSDRHVLSAEIRRSGARTLRSGDFLTTAAFPWTIGDRRDEVIDVSEI